MTALGDRRTLLAAGLLFLIGAAGLIFLPGLRGEPAKKEPATTTGKLDLTPRSGTLTVFYDNYPNDSRLTTEWGFACILDLGEDIIMFDTGGKLDVTGKNVEAIGFDPTQVTHLVISHEHWDHIGGLDYVLNRNSKLEAFIPAASPASLKASIKSRAGSTMETGDATQVCEGVATTRVLDGPPMEQALIVKTAAGLILITGCSHPGVDKLVESVGVSTGEKVRLVIGGFHLGGASEAEVATLASRLKTLGVEKVAPTHCTGDASIAAFERAYGSSFRSVGVGFTMKLPEGVDSLPVYYPTGGWRSAKPAEVGLNPDTLTRMVADIKASGVLTQSSLVVKDGYMVVEEYYNGYHREDRHQLYSCTKTVVGTLIGIAAAEGRLKVTDKLPDLLPKEAMEPWMREITLENLLTMSAGLPGDDWLYNWVGLNEMLAAPDPLRYALTRPKTFEPGSRFEYTNAVSHTLSCIITEKTGMSAAVYAEAKLFKPLGITDYQWKADAQGRSWGYAQLYLKPSDMAKIGLLYLRMGEWDGVQVVPAAWIREATKHRIDANLLDGYGYQLWVDDDGWYTALGYQGQFIMVFPKMNTVAVFTGGTPATYDYNIRLADRFIIPAVASGNAKTA